MLDEEEELDELRAYLDENQEYEVRRDRQRRGEPNPFASRESFLSPSLTWVDSAPDSLFQALEVFFLTKQVEASGRRKDLEALLDASAQNSFRDRIRNHLRPHLLPTAIVTIAPKEDLIMDGKCKKRIRFTLPPYIAPQTKLASFTPSLKHYLNGDGEKQQIWFRTDDFVVVYDAYPKAAFHFLILPKTGEIPNVHALMKSADLTLVQRMQALAKECLQEIKSVHAGGCFEFRLGFHLLPSLEPLHLHCISEDFDSTWMNTWKHWNSFTNPELWISLEDVELALKNERDCRLPHARREAGGDRPRCAHCAYTPASTLNAKDTLEQLKRHLRTKSCLK